MEEDKIVFPYGNNIGFQEGVLAQRKVNDLKRLQMMVRYATAKKHSAVVYRYFNYSSFDEIQLDESMLPNFKKEIMRFIGNYTIAKTDMIKILTDPADEQLALLPDFAGIFKGIWTGYLRTELEELVFEGLIRQAKVSQANYYHLAKEGGRYLDKLGYEHKHPESVVASFRHFDHREMIVNALLAWMRKMDISAYN